MSKLLLSLVIMLCGAALLSSFTASASSIKTVRVKDSVFAPSAISVSKGSKLRFVWVGKLPHNLVGGGVNYSSRTHGSVTIKVNRSATYVCQLHNGMKLKVTAR